MATRGDLPRDLDRIITRCLEKNPRDRIQTARDVYNELRYLKREVERGAPATSTPSSPGISSRPQSYAPPTPTPSPPTPSSAPASTSGSGQIASGVATPPPRDAPSIAVLPFVNRSRGEEDEYFSDGLADELLNVLTKIRGLRVAARASSFLFKGKNEDLAVIGEKLNVATLLDGSVRKAGNRVRISVQLIKASDRVQLWSETYDRSLDDIFAVQDDIAQSVVKELRSTLLGQTPDSDASGRAQAEVAAAAKGHGQNPEAHRLYLQGKYFVDRMTARDTERGLEYLNEAVALDPTHAGAWAEISRAYSNSGGYGWLPVSEGYEKAREAVRRSIAADPGLAVAYVRLSGIQRAYDWDWEGAQASIRRALELAPGSAIVLSAAGNMAHQLLRSDEAEQLLRQALEQDPLNAATYNALALVYRTTDRLSDAERAVRKVIEIAPNRIGAHLIHSIILAEMGRHEEALSEANLEAAPWARDTALVVVHFKAGRELEARETLRHLEENYAVESGYQIACCYAVLGDRDRAFTWLERGVAERDSGMVQAPSERVLRPLHNDPRWSAFLKKIGFPEQGTTAP